MARQRSTHMPSFQTDPEAALESYHQLGYHIEEDMLSADECEAIIRASEDKPEFRDGTFAPLMQPHRVDPVFLTALRNPKIVEIMERLVAGRVSGLQIVYYYGRPGVHGFTMHQDNYFVETKADAFVSAWTPMQDVDAEMGGMVGYPGSHVEPVLPVLQVEDPLKSSGQDPNATREELVLPPGYEPVDLPVPRGAAIFMHANSIHSSNVNKTDQFRRSLVMTYLRSGEPFRPGFTAKREEVSVY